MSINKTDFQKDKVYLFQFPRAKCCPSISPFCLKLESWLRFANIDYESIETMTGNSVKGQKPFVELNGKQIADTTFIIDELSDYFKKENIGPTMTEVEQGQALAFERMVENDIFWKMVFFRSQDLYSSVFGPEAMQDSLPFYAKYLRPVLEMKFRRDSNARLHGQGTGRHSVEENTLLTIRAMKAISYQLGTKKYFCGDSPNRYDAAIFGCLAQFYYTPIKNGVTEFLRDDKEHGNIREYLDRIKTTYFSDWTELTEGLKQNGSWKPETN